MTHPLRLAPLLALLVACGEVTGPADVAVLRFDPEVDSYGISVERLETLESLSELRGAAGRAIGGARIHLDPRARRPVQVKDGGGPVAAQFLEQDGAHWPLDFHSLNLATTYFNLEQARGYARARGLGAELDRITFHYFPEMTVAGERGIFADNAAYIPSLGTFVLPPFVQLQDIPLSMNAGVIAHEYGHAIFTALVHQGDGEPDFTARWCPGDVCSAPSAWVLMGVLEEGFADAWALGVVRDVRFLERSAPQAGPARRVEPFDPARHCTSDRALRQEIAAQPGLDPRYWQARQYPLGTIWASALWRAGAQAGTDYDRVMDALLASYRPLGELIRQDPTGETFGRYATVTHEIARAAPDEPTRQAICAVLRARFAIPARDAGICASTPPIEECG